MDIKIEDTTATTTLPTLSVSSSGTAISVVEGSSVVFVFTLSEAANKDSTVNLKVTPLSDVLSEESFQNLPTQFTIPAGVKSKTLTIQALDDNYFDARTRSYKLQFTTSDLNLEATSFQITVTENETVPVISFSSATSNVNETAGSSNSTISLTPASKQAITVNYNFVDQTAANGTEYTGANSSVTFAALETSKNIPFTIIDDSQIETTETFQIQLSSPSGPGIGTQNTATLGSLNTKTISIIDNDYPTISITDATANKGNTISFTVSLSVASSSTVTVDWASADQTALSGTHYTSNSGSLIFNPGQTSKTLTLNTTNTAGVCSSDKDFNINLSNATNASIGDSQAIGTIQDPTRPTISIANATIAEGNTGNVTVSLSQACIGKTVGFSYSSTNNTANDGLDFNTVSGSGSITSGNTSTTISVVTLQDSIYETDEIFSLDISNLSNATAGTSTATVTITDDESMPTLQWSATSSSVLENVNTVTLTAQLSGTSKSTVTANISLTGTSTLNTDYTISPSSVSIAAGSTSATITLTISDDSSVESSETVIATLDTLSGATLGTNSVYTLTVGDNDKALAIYPSTLVLNPSETYTFNATGGTGGFTYSVVSASGGTFGTAGNYTAPTSAGTYTVRVTDSFSNTNDATVIILDSQNDSSITSYFRADKITGLNNGDAVSSWTDWKASIAVSQGTASYKPTYVTNAVNSKPVVRFDGVNDYLSASTFVPATGANARTLVHVFINKDTTTSSNNGVSFWGADSNLQDYGLYASGNSSGNFGSSNITGYVHGYSRPYSTPKETVSNITPSNATRLVIQTYNGSTDKMYIDGNLSGSNDVTLNTGSTYKLNLGRLTYGTSYYFNGDIAEVITFNTDLTDANRKNLECLLGFRYNLSISNSVCTSGPLNLSTPNPLLKISTTATITATGGVPPYTFTVLSGGGTLASVNSNSQTFTAPNTASTSVLKVTDYIGNQSTVTITTQSTTSTIYHFIANDLNSSNDDGTSISVWKDNLNRNDRFTQVTSTKRPVLKKNIINGHSVLRFDGVDDELNSGIFPALGANPREVLVVSTNATFSSAHSDIFTYGYSNSGTQAFTLSYALGNRGPTPYVGAHLGTVQYAYQNVGTSIKPNSSPMILSLAYDGSYGYVYQNGVLKGQSPLTLTLASDKGQALSIGMGQAGTNPFKGDIAEVLVFDSVLSASDRKTIACELSLKYNITNSNGSCNTGALTLTATGTQVLGPSENFTVSAEGGTPPYSFSVSSGSGSIHPSTGVYTAPSVSGGTDTVTVTDSASNSVNLSISTISHTAPKFWLSADSLSQSDSTETTLISDLTGNNNFSYAISGKTPLFKTNMINGKPYLYFDSTQSDLLLSGYMPPSGANNRTIIAVYADAATTADGSNSRLMFAYGKDYGNAFGFISVHSTNLKMYTQSNTLVGGTTATPTTATIAEVGVNGTSVYLYMNGTLDTSSTQTVNTLGYNSLWIGAGWWSGAGQFTGGIAEIMAFDKALSASERNDVTTYLKSKYNIP